MKQFIFAFFLLIATTSIGFSQGTSFSNFITSAPTATMPLPEDSIPIVQGSTTHNISPTTLARRLATSNPTANKWFVRTGGSDSNDCLSSIVSGTHGPCASISYVLGKALATDAQQADLVIDIGAGTFNGPVTINGPAVGTASKDDFVYAGSQPMVRLLGAGSASTTILGVKDVGGQGFCYAVLANNNAQVVLQGLSIKADDATGVCGISDLFIQNANVYIQSDVKLLQSSGNLVSMEERGLLYITPGTTTPGLTLVGPAAGNAFNVDSQSQVTSDSSILIPAPLVLGSGSGCLFTADYQSLFKFALGNPVITNNASITGYRFCLSGNSAMAIGHPPTTWGGTRGFVNNGSRYEASDAAACVGGSVGCNLATAPTGLGTGGTAAVATGSAPYAGAVQLTAGTSASTTGTVRVGFPYDMVRGVCTVGLVQGTGSWGRAVVYTSGFTETVGGLILSWDNNGVALSNGLTYFISYVCNTAQ